MAPPDAEERSGIVYAFVRSVFRDILKRMDGAASLPEGGRIVPFVPRVPVDDAVGGVPWRAGLGVGEVDAFDVRGGGVDRIVRVGRIFFGRTREADGRRKGLVEVTL